MTQYSSAGKARSEALRRKCVEFLAHYSLSKAHSGCTVTYDKDTATVKVCEDKSADVTAAVSDSSYTNVSFSGTGLNDWYRALNRAGYRTFMGGHELFLTIANKEEEEEIWHYLTPPLHTHGNSSGSSASSDEEQGTSTGAITFMGHNTSCTFQITVNYNSNSNGE